MSINVSRSNVSRSALGTTFLALSVTTDGPATRIAAAGELDSSTATLLGDTVADALRAPAGELVRLDLTHLTFLDSAGIRCLLECRGRVDAAGARFEIADASKVVRDVLAITGLLAFFGLPERTVAVPRKPGRGPFGPRDHERVLAEAAAVRQAARETRERAIGMREAGDRGQPGRRGGASSSPLSTR